MTSAISWFEIPTRRLDAAQAFYETVLGRPMRREAMGPSEGAVFAYDAEVGVGGALMMGPKALLLDEPSIGLAPKLVDQVLQTLRTLASAGLAILLVEQNVRAAMEVVDRLVLIERGRMVLEGPAQTVGNDPRIAEAYLGATAGAHPTP